MIDADSEQLLALNQVPAYREKMTGRRMNLATVYRHRNTGCAGVRLEITYVAGRPYTSVEALQRFDAKVTAAKLAPSVPMTKATPKQAARAHERAKAKLASST